MKRESFLSLTSFGLMLLSLSSCAPRPSVYLPTAPQTPWLSRAGEFRANLNTNAGINGSSEADSYTSVDAAYAVNEDRAVIGSVAFSSPSSDSNGLSYLYGELGVGYYKKFDAYGHFEFYGGAGYGNIKISTQDGGYPYSSESAVPIDFFTQKQGSFVRPFLQANIAAEGQVAGIGLSLRASYLSIGRLQTDSSWRLYTYDTSGNRSFGTTMHSSHTEKYTGIFLEPALTFTLGVDRVKFVTKTWWSIPVSEPPPFLWAGVSFSAGVTVDIGARDE